MTLVPFVKVESIGNDFVLIEAKNVPAERLPDFALAACERRFGIGSDGLLVVSMEGDFLRLRMFNPDGTEDFCGNGLRCAAVYARYQEWVPDRFVIKHLDREVETETMGQDRVRTVLGRASYRPADVPHTLEDELFHAVFDIKGERVSNLSALTTGSTHSVILVEDLPNDAKFERLSKALEHHPIFPDRTSVIWARPDGDALQIRIWERGVGETLGCGTGSSAAANVFSRTRKRGGSVVVKNPGGEVTVSMDDWQSPISVEGVAEIVYRGVFRFHPNDPGRGHVD